MFKHLCLLVWNRRKTNTLVMIELFVALLVLCFVITASLYMIHSYRQPLGFSYTNIWSVGIDTEQMEYAVYPEQQIQQFRRIVQTLRALPQIEAVTITDSPPFSGGTHTWVLPGSGINVDVTQVNDDYQSVLGMEIVSGRWFHQGDEGAHYTPVLINQHLASMAFGTESPIGKIIIPPGTQGVRGSGCRVVGVISGFRKRGDFFASTPCMLERIQWSDTTKRSFPSTILIKLRPGVTADFENTLMNILQNTERTWSFGIRPLEDARKNNLKMFLIPLSVASIVAVFLLSMVALGLVGIVWQSVARRTREIGARRAFGATSGNILQLVLSETLILTTFAIIPALLIVLQAPLFNLLSFIPPFVYLLGIGVSIGLLYGIVTLCTVYPGYIASKIQPSEALRYE